MSDRNLIFVQHQRIETECLILRSVTLNDVENPVMKKEGIISSARCWKSEILSLVLRGITKKEWQEQQHKKQVSCI